jgi:sulfate transport system substrate-binding protein
MVTDGHEKLVVLAAVLALSTFGGCDKGSIAPPERSPNARLVPRLPSVTLSFAAFSAAHEAFGTRILPGFAERWWRSRGQRIRWQERYEGSRRLAESLANEFRADVAVLASTHDMQHLVETGLVRKTWQDAPHGGIVSRSLVALAVRRGNPKAIHDWKDLVRPGIQIVMPNPETSGGGRWDICALYGAALRGHAGVAAGDARAALAFVKRVLANVVEQPESASEAYRSFQSGVGDVAIAYESQIALGWLFGHADVRVIPRSTLLIENAAAVIDANADHHRLRREAEALLHYLWTVEAQKRLAFCGLRPVDAAVAAETEQQFPRPADLWTIDDLGGWERVSREIHELTGVGARPSGDK